MEQSQTRNNSQHTIEAMRRIPITEGMIRFMAGTNEVIRNLIMRLRDIKVAQDPGDPNKHIYIEGNNPLVNKFGLSRIMFFIEGVNNEVTKLGNHPSEDAVKITLKRLLNNFAEDMSVAVGSDTNNDDDTEDWGINDKDINLVYETLHIFTKSCVYDSLKGFKTRELGKASEIKESNAPMMDHNKPKNKGLSFLK